MQTAMLAAVLMHPGCASTANDADGAIAPSSSAGGGAATPGTGAGGSLHTLAFEPEALTLPVLGQSTVAVRVSPADGQAVSFALIGNSLDASLAAAEIVTDASGLAAVVLTASSSPTTFSVRASINRTTVAETEVKVTEATSGSIDVSVKYSGTRRVGSYEVKVFAHDDCSSESLNGSVRKLAAATATSLPMRLENVPLTSPITIVVDGGKAVHGCTVVHGLAAQPTLVVEVPLDDLPLNLYDQTLDLALFATDGLSALKSSLDPSVQTFLGALVLGTHDLTDLLSAMESSAAGSLQQEFVSLRGASGWDELVISTYAVTGGSDLLRRHVRDWLARGIELLSTQPTFEVQLDLGPLDYSKPSMSLIRVSGIDALAHLSMQSSELALNVETNDRLNWSAAMSFNKATLLDMLASTAASIDVPGVDGIPEQLDLKLDCDDFAATLDQNAVWVNANSRVCTATCLATLCRAGLSTMHQRAIAAAFGLPTTPLVISAAGNVTVSTTGQPTAARGDWIGVWSTESGAVPLSGTYESR